MASLSTSLQQSPRQDHGERASDDMPATYWLLLAESHLSVSNSSSGRRWKLDHAPAVRDPTHMVEFGTGRRAFAREA